jgi:hypothetical protein
MSDRDRISYDTAASAEVQGGIRGIIGRLEGVIGDRDRAVKAAMADFRADGVSEAYHDKEVRWNHAAGEVRRIISLLTRTLSDNDSTAGQAQSRARSAVEGI